MTAPVLIPGYELAPHSHCADCGAPLVALPKVVGAYRICASCWTEHTTIQPKITCRQTTASLPKRS